MPHLLLTELPRFDCLLAAAQHYPDLDPTACEVFLHLLYTGDELHRHEANYLKTHSMAKGRFALLLLLERNSRNLPDCKLVTSPAEIADALGVTRATVTGLIDTLEKDGLVQRQPDQKDRRTVPVALTDKGVELIRNIQPAYFRHITAAMCNLSEPERKTLVHLLEKIRDTISPAPTENTPEHSEIL